MIEVHGKLKWTGDQYVIVNRLTSQIVDSHFTRTRTVGAVMALNVHEVECGREPVYEAYPKERVVIVP